MINEREKENIQKFYMRDNIDGFSRLMGEKMAYTVEMISRGITFYICVSISGIITLIGYFAGRKGK